MSLVGGVFVEAVANTILIILRVPQIPSITPLAKVVTSTISRLMMGQVKITLLNFLPDTGAPEEERVASDAPAAS